MLYNLSMPSEIEVASSPTGTDVQWSSGVLGIDISSVLRERLGPISQRRNSDRFGSGQAVVVLR